MYCSISAWTGTKPLLEMAETPFLQTLSNGTGIEASYVVTPCVRLEMHKTPFPRQGNTDKRMDARMHAYAHRYTEERGVRYIETGTGGRGD